MSQAETPEAKPPTATHRQEPRESVWSIRRKHADTFFATMFTLWVAVAATATVVYLNDNSRPENTEAAGWFIRATLEILQDLGVATVPVVVTAMILNRPLTIVGGAIVITYEAAKARWVTKVIQRHEARGEARGRAEATAEANQLWEQWWERRQAAEASGEPFDEPPPSVSE